MDKESVTIGEAEPGAELIGNVKNAFIIVFPEDPELAHTYMLCPLCKAHWHISYRQLLTVSLFEITLQFLNDHVIPEHEKSDANVLEMICSH